MAKKHIAKQIEVKWEQPEAFALKVEQAQDGERIASENARIIKLKEAAEKQQLTLN